MVVVGDHGGQGVVVVGVEHGVQEEEEAAGHTGLALALRHLEISRFGDEQPRTTDHKY